MYSSLWIRMWLPWGAGTQHGHVQPVGGRGAGGDDCRVQLWQVSHQPEQGLHHLCPAGVLSYLDQRDGCAGQTAPGHPRESRFAVRTRRHFSICFTFSVFCLIDNPSSRYTWWTCTRSQVKRSHYFQSCVDIIFGTLFYPQSLGNTKSTCFLCFDLAIDNPDYLVRI